MGCISCHPKKDSISCHLSKALLIYFIPKESYIISSPYVIYISVITLKGLYILSSKTNYIFYPKRFDILLFRKSCILSSQNVQWPVIKKGLVYCHCKKVIYLVIPGGQISFSSQMCFYVLLSQKVWYSVISKGSYILLSQTVSLK